MWFWHDNLYEYFTYLLNFFICSGNHKFNTKYFTIGILVVCLL